MSKRVLVVDDDPAILEVIQIVLEDEGYTVYTDDGFNRSDYRRSPVDLVLLDIWMRGIDGRMIAKQLKGAGHPAKVILMSAHGDAERAVDETGADGFMAKPFELDELVAMVAEYMDE
jgi:DNA-binding response OmpR family regulator